MPHSVTSCLQTYTKYAESFLIAITKLIEIILIFCDLTSALCKILFPSHWTPGTNMHAHVTPLQCPPEEMGELSSFPQFIFLFESTSVRSCKLIFSLSTKLCGTQSTHPASYCSASYIQTTAPKLNI